MALKYWNTEPKTVQQTQTRASNKNASHFNFSFFNYSAVPYSAGQN